MATVTADLTGIDIFKLRIDPEDFAIAIYLDGNYQGRITETEGFVTLESSGLDNYGPNTTVTIEGADDYDSGTFWIDYVYGNIIQPEPASKKIELVDTGGL